VGAESAGQSDSPMGSIEPEGERSLLVEVARQWVAQNRGWGRSLLAKCASPMGSTEPEGRSLVVEVVRHWVAPNRGRSLLFKVTHRRVAQNRRAESIGKM